MGQIGKWIDQECKASPDVMREVLRRKWGNLEVFFDNHTKGCGCMVGTKAIVAGDSLVEHPFRGIDGQKLYTPRMGRDCDVGAGVRDLIFERGDPSRVPRRKQAEVIRLLKNRIRRSLGIPLTETIVEVDPSQQLETVSSGLR